MKFRHIQFTIFSLVVSITVFSYLFSKVSLTEVIDTTRNILPVWLGLFLFFSFAMSIFRTWRYQLLLSSSGYSAPSVPLFLVTLVRNFFSDLLPARLGTLIYVYLIRSRLNIPLAPALSSFAHAFIFDIISLALLVIPAILITSLTNQSSFVLLAAGIGLGGVSIALLFFLPKCTHMAAKLCNSLIIIPQKWRIRLHEELISTEHHLVQARRHGIYWHILALSFGVRSCKYLCLYVLLLGLVLPMGYGVADFPLAKVFLGLCSAELASSLPISGIAGFGAYEGAWAFTFQLLGYPENLALLTGISHHLFTQVYGYSLGGLALLILLLPVFRQDSSKMEENRFKKGKHLFWLKFILTTLSVILVASLFARAAHTNKGSENEHLKMQKFAQAAGGPEAVHYTTATLPGKLVYQRSGGIFMTDLTTGKDVQLVETGTFPRWSADGQLVVYVRDKAIMLFDIASKNSRKIADATDPRAVCFHSKKNAVIFTDGKFLRQVDLKSLKVVDLLNDGRFREVDISNDGKILVGTVKTMLGFEVRKYEYPELTKQTISRGCSASLSPDGRFLTVNSRDHRALHLFNSKTLKQDNRIMAPPGNRFDNQFWSNHPDWVVSTSEGDKTDIYIHHVTDGSFLQVTSSGNCDRADLYVDQE